MASMDLSDLFFDDQLPTKPAAGPTPEELKDAIKPEEGPRTGRDIQRGALRDLVALASECATLESEIEREYRTGKDQGGKSIGDREFQLDQRHTQAVADANQKHQAKLAQIAAQYKSERNKIAAGDKAGRAKAEGERASIEEKLKKKFDQAVWLADSVLEAANGQAGLTYKTTAGAIQSAQDEINGYEVQSAKLVQQYGVALPTDEIAVEEDPQITADADVAFTAHKTELDTLVSRLGRMPTANLFVGGRPWFVAIILLLLTTAAVQFFMSDGKYFEPQITKLEIYDGALIAVMIILGVVLRMAATRQVRAVHTPLRKQLVLARQAADKQMANAAEKYKQDQHAANEARNKEVKVAKEQVAPIMAKAKAARDATVAAVSADSQKQLARIDQIRDKAKAEIDAWLARQLKELEDKKQADLLDNKTGGSKRLTEIEDRYQTRKAELKARWDEGQKQIQAPIDQDGEAVAAVTDWSDPSWNTWKPSKKFASRVRFGQMQVDLRQIADNVPKTLNIPATFPLPAVMAFPGQASLLINADHSARMEAIQTLQAVMARLLTSLPPGRVRFTIIDPVGLGENFAGFMHLRDYDEALVDGQIWTSQDKIDQKLANLAEHMETVIQKYLRNEFKTIDDYNAQAGELAEPYRFLVIADLPTNFSSEAFRRLNSIASSGARCGVYTLISRDTRAALPQGAHLDELKSHSVNLIRKDDRFVWDDEVFAQLPLDLERPPTDDQLTAILHKVGVGAKEAKRVEVPFSVIAPTSETMWTRSTSSELSVEVGRMGANRFQSLKLGKGTSQHVLIAGKTGSGKSTLMHAMIVNAAMWYSPDEVELYLVDFKKGVEFKTYAHNLLPHARAIAVESDREFGLSLLTRLDVELARRGELFRKASVQDLAAYRKSGFKEVVPRTLLIIDEFQEFFTEDDKVAQEAALLIERLVRQGRAFGMHVLLGSQTIGGAGGLPRAVLGQFAVRIALQTSEADSQLILGDNNSAAKLLTRPGEAIYNDAGGLVEGNSPFQVAYLSDAARDVYLKDLASKAEPYFKRFGHPIVFEGSAPAEIRRNAQLMRLLDSSAWPKSLGTPGAQGWMGDPVAIKDATAISFRRQSGTNVLIVGQAEEQTTAIVSAMMVSVGVQQSPSQATIYMMDGTATDSNFFGTFEKVKSALPHDVKMVDFRAVGDVIDEIAQEVTRRQDAESASPSIYLFVYGLQRFRNLRKSEDEFSFSTSDEPAKPNPGKQFAEILREGPPVGVHVIVWADTLISVDRTFDRGVMREFDNRVLFQMSAADSSNLIDSPNANKLGAHKALVYSEEQGIMERFRPYAIFETDFLVEVKKKLGARAEAAQPAEA